MSVLKEPSNKLVKKVLHEVSFEERFEGFSLRERSGAMSVTMYKFEEVVSFLNDRNPRMDFDDLEGWVRNAMGDTELADHIKVVLRDAGSDQERSDRIKMLMEERLHQCKGKV